MNAWHTMAVGEPIDSQRCEVMRGDASWFLWGSSPPRKPGPTAPAPEKVTGHEPRTGEIGAERAVG